MCHAQWDYSWHNLDACAAEGTSQAPVLRYLPPGYLQFPSHPTTAVVAGVVADAPRGRRKKPPVLIFPGQPMFGSLRTRCWFRLKRRLGHRLQYVYNVWNDTMFAREIVGRYNLSLNLHRECGDAQQPLEAFRISQLVSAGRLVISERSYPRDEAEYQGIGA